MAGQINPLDLGIRFIVEPSGPVLLDHEARALQDLRPAGIMLRKRNFKQNEPYGSWLKTYRDLLLSCRQAIGRESIVVSIDHEGGAVHRFPEPITRFPYAATYGANQECVFEVASMMGAELAALGINVSFSPVADIHSNPSNPVINQRAFGTEPEGVAAAAIACARGLRQNGVIPCAKHFPGHGDTATDSHFSVPVLSASIDDLRKRELAPFKALIDSGIELIMTAHIMVPSLDPDNQATISPRILTDLLRSELGFKGLTVADALGMSGIKDQVAGEAFGVKAHNAGLDLFLFVGDNVSIDDAVLARDRLSNAEAAGHLDRSSLLKVQTRVGSFIDLLPRNEPIIIAAEDLRRHSELARKLKENAPWSDFKFSPEGFY